MFCSELRNAQLDYKYYYDIEYNQNQISLIQFSDYLTKFRGVFRTSQTSMMELSCENKYASEVISFWGQPQEIVCLRSAGGKNF